MRLPDWIVLAITLLGIILYGLYKSRTTKNLEGYFLSNRTLPWYLVLLSIMGTQASAITFLSGPGQAYTDGMRFVQYYFGLPLAMVVLCITFVPIFNRLKVFTAYEYLEQRFDVKTRALTSFLFLLQRGLSTGISVAAPSIILSALLGWDITWTNIFMGGLLIIYTVTGGAKAVAYTQQLQLIIIFAGMFLAAYLVITMLPDNMSFTDALRVSGRADKLNVITTGAEKGSFDWTDRYNIWSGIIGGFFLALSYFGTDQSQVGRYLTAKSTSESRLGLLMNGLVKVPMQFLILLVGALVFVFYQFNPAPLFFNQSQVDKAKNTAYAQQVQQIQRQYDSVNIVKKQYLQQWVNNGAHEAAWEALNKQSDSLRASFKEILKRPDVQGEHNDTNYIFLRFVVDYLPKGLVGLLIAVIFLAAWGSIAAALNSLASSTMVDFHKRFSRRQLEQKAEYRWSQWYTFLWGVFCIIVAQFATVLGNSLIEAVNILGSLFYGVILGIFLVAFYLKRIGSTAVFISALVVEAGVMLSFKYSNIGFLWLNAIGALGVVMLSIMLDPVVKSTATNAQKKS
ncbi:MAG TPA: sodium:solute symporter [Chitinophagaceae bacterium]|nr:sodium:solute symporter [Chitinophagaceae bacterium]